MTKSEMLSDPNSTWNQARDDEPLFVISARDPAFSGVVRQHAFSKRSMGALPEQVDQLLEDARAGGDWKEAHFPTPKKQSA